MSVRQTGQAKEQLNNANSKTCSS